jgi:catechol 2,3-dioxygenase-like lactoylglutathione lyase family enzyme
MAEAPFEDPFLESDFRLSQCDPVVFVPVRDFDRAKEFYGGRLGLPLLREELPFALVYDLNGIMLRLAVVGGQGTAGEAARGTVAGWRVARIRPAVRFLGSRGVETERYGFLEQDEDGIWTSPSGARIAWFRDPEGNLLSVSEHPELDGLRRRPAAT